ncbi:MAG TPA: iron ABC transporter permease [Stellaceae bacterium]|jgi:iron(III) transport system permease protein|nr:iron ABC transporter permease [Stellaceae bacterium]
MAVYGEGLASPPARVVLRRRRWPHPGVVVAVVCLLVVLAYPVLMLVSSAFNAGDPQDLPATQYGFTHVGELLDHADWIRNTLIVSLGGTIIATAIAAVLAWVFHRTTVPGHNVFETLIAIPYPLGPLVGGLAWSVLGSPRAGVINQAFRYVSGSTTPLINTSSITGIVLVMAVFEAPVAVLMIGAAMRRMDPSLEECSAVFGGGRLRTALRVTLPLMMPAILSAALFVFTTMMGSFAIPAILGSGARFYVATTAIYVLFQGYPPNYPLAALLGLVLIAITGAAVWLNQHLLKGRSFTVIGGRGYRPRRIDVGIWKWPLFGFACLYVLVSLVLPLGTLAIASLQRTADIDWTGATWTLANFRYVLVDFPTTRAAIINSLLLGIGTGTIGVVIAALLAWLVHRATGPGRRFLEQLAMLPQAFPHLVFAVGLLWMVLTLPLNIYNTLYAVLFGYLIIFIPLGYRTMSGVMVQVDQALEEAARVSGARWHRVMRTVTIPLLRNGITATWALLFMVSVREISASIFLSGPDSQVLGPAILNFWDSGGLPRVSALAIVQAVIVLVMLVIVRRLDTSHVEA